MSHGQILFDDAVEAVGSNGAAINAFLSFVDNHTENCYISGDTFAFPGLKKIPGLNFITAKYKERGDDAIIHIEVILQAYKNVYGCDYNQSQNKLKEDINAWLPSNCEEGVMIIKSQDFIRSEPDFFELKVMLVVDSWIAREFIGEVIESPFYHEYWNAQMNSIITEGVCYAKDKVPTDLIKRLREQINAFSRKTPVDYHPKSDDVVRDFIHPGLYPYIQGVSKCKKNAILPDKETGEKRFDFWGRKYEDSKFQWLPTLFKINDDGKCFIQDYINNLDRELFPEFYCVLKELFEIFLPYFEEVWSYCKAINFFKGDTDDEDKDEIHPLDRKKISFNGNDLQIIVKVVEYALQPNQSYEGVWHAEGMSHENIVMTGIYFLDRSLGVSGGDLRFKRPFTVEERSKVFWNIQQCRPEVVNKFASDGFVPLGHIPTTEGYILVFPNCHIHKISKMINQDSKDLATRRIVVFFFVNPEKKIISTREVNPQQEVISLDTAKNYRLELMAERKYDKEKLNVRDIELCEH